MVYWVNISQSSGASSLRLSRIKGRQMVVVAAAAAAVVVVYLPWWQKSSEI